MRIAGLVLALALVPAFAANEPAKPLPVTVERGIVYSKADEKLLLDIASPSEGGPYPAVLGCNDPDRPRDRLTVGLRILLAIPHFVVLFFVLSAWWVTTILAWFLILITGRYPQMLHGFGAGALRWLIRVEAYVLLLVDDYPPFSLR